MIRFRIPDMSCQHCVRAVTEALQQVEAGVPVTVELEKREVSIDSQGDVAAFSRALTEAGYPPAG